MDLYQIDIRQLEKQSDSIDFWRSYIAKERFEYAMRYRRYEDRLRSIGAGLIIQQGLKKRGIKIKTEKEDDGIPYKDVIGFGENQKPYIKNKKDICFNLSHSGQYVVGVFSDCECGVDIEKDNANIEFLKKYYSEKEWQYVMRNPQKNATRLWTLKESYVKLTGTGIIKKLPEIEISELADNFSQIIEGEQYYFSEFTFIDGYSLSVCSREKQQIKKTQD